MSNGTWAVKKIKLVIATLFIVSIAMVLASESIALPPYVAKAKKFGAKDCLFCHVREEADATYNERGNWLLKEKERRAADAIDIEWLTDYKPENTEGKP